MWVFQVKLDERERPSCVKEDIERDNSALTTGF